MAQQGRRAFTLLELLIALAVVGVLTVLLLPALSSARTSSHRAVCAGNQRLIGEAWAIYLEGSDGRFPVVYVQPAWRYGGVRFSRIDGTPRLDHNRPLNRYMPGNLGVPAEVLFRCPADQGITGEHAEVGTGSRTAYEAFGTSYRANAKLLSPPPAAPPDYEGMPREAITTAASRLVVMGDPFWYEIRESTGRRAAWHGAPHRGNLLFLDGSVRYMQVEPEPAVGPAVFDPSAPGLAFPMEKR